MDKRERIDAWHEIIDIVEGYLEENGHPNTPVVDYQPAIELKQLLNLHLTEEGINSQGLLEEVKNYLKYSVRTTHPQFNNQLNAGFNFEALIGEIVSFISNTSMATFEISPVATLMERKLIDELNSLLGYSNGSGIMVTGGSNANMMAIHCARNRMFPENKFKGNPNSSICVFVSKDAHYSFQKAVSLMGLGLDNLILIDTDANGVMSPTDLEAKIVAAKEAGKTPLMVASTGGTTVMGAFDNIEENDKVAKKFNLWHHIDGAWGGAALFSKNTKELLKGCEKSDSFTFDSHKLLGTGLITSFFLTKDKEIIREANSGGGGQYLFHEYENSEYDTGVYSLQCGRKVDSLKLWLTWKSLGYNGLEKFVDGQMEKRDHMKALIEKHPRMKLLHDPQYLNLCFQVIPEDKNTCINKYNLELRFKLVREGKFLVNYSSFEDGTIFFRHVFANNVTTKEDLEYFLDELIKLG